MLVIDEADLVLSFGYEDDIRGIVAHLPKIHQSMLLSATLNKGVESLKQLVLSAPAILKLEDNRDELDKLVQYVVRCSEEDKFLLTFVILKLRLISGKCLLFVNDIERCYRLKLFLEQFSIRACVLNSELPLNSRYHIVEEFNRGVYDYIIATDESDQMADGEEKPTKRKRGQDKEYGVSRGIDFKGVSAVINFDFPASARSYTHRVGRTARAGARGMSLSFINTQSDSDERVFENVVQQKQGEILPYKFDMTQVNGFRYRSTDALRMVTRNSIREARIKEIKQEILNSSKLKSHFEDKPKDLQFLQHDKELRPSVVMPHMKHIPQYLLPKISGIAQADGVAGAVDVGFVPFNKVRKQSSDAEDVPHKRAKTELSSESRPYALPDHISYERVADKFPELKQHLIKRGTFSTIDFLNNESVRILNRALLAVYFDLNVHLPAHNLCPTVANRLHYIEWIQRELLSELSPLSKVRGLDVGCGASCIYPLLGTRVLNCEFVGTDINSDSIETARQNVERNAGTSIQLFLNSDARVTLPVRATGFPQIEEDGDGSVFTFSMCNPPFYSSRNERARLREFKQQEPGLETQGEDDELFTEGGEEAFLNRMVDESKHLGACIKWYSTLVGKKSTLAGLKTRIRQTPNVHIREGTLVQGKTTRWVVAWSFLGQTRFCLDKLPEDREATMKWFKGVMSELRVQVQHKNACFVCEAREKTWTRQWRRQQQLNKTESVETSVLLRFTAVYGSNGNESRIDLYLEPGFPSNLLMSLYNHLIRRVPSDISQ
ncbi:ATP-dependent DNA/RNA helicase [Coemansia sp. RSA 1878]|nr:ATP-dependent DNA/RNA helicase [Coemansia sp. RSA 1878]